MKLSLLSKIAVVVVLLWSFIATVQALTMGEILNGKDNSRPQGQVLGASTAWYNSSWNYRKAITIDHTKVSGSLSNFPVLISLTDTDIKANAKADGSDILFTDADGTTKVDHEIEKYNSATGELIVWVRVPTLSPSVDHTLYIYFGNASASNQQNPSGVWDSSFKGVWHLANGVNLNVNDSTSNANNGTNSGATAAVTGQIDGAVSLDKSKYAYINDSPGLRPGLNDFTVSLWVNIPFTATGSDGRWPNIFLKGLTTSAPAHTWGFYGYADYHNQIGYAQVSDAGGSFTADFNSGVLPNGWNYLVVKRTAATTQLYVNGQYSDQNTNTGDNLNSNSQFYIGGNSANGTHFIGTLDEARFSSIARSADWIKTEYNNQNNLSNFYYLQTLEVYGSPADIQAPTVPSGLSTTVVSPSQINLSWTASTDNVGVTGYKVYRGGTQIGTSINTSYQDARLSASTNYSYTTSAYDAAGNTTAQSSSASATTQALSNVYWMTGYYEDGYGWEPVSAIPWSKYTHIMHFAAAAGVNGGGTGDGSVSMNYLTASGISQIVAAAHAAGKKVLVTIKDNSYYANAFTQDTAPAMIGTFVNSIVNFVNSNGYDGVDLDWEGNISVSQYVDLISRLRTAFGSNKLITTASMGDLNTLQSVASQSHANLDQINVMCYDMDMWQTFAWHNDALFQNGNANLSACDWRTNPLVSSGVAKSKIGIGVPFYGRRWTGVTAPLQTGGQRVGTIYYKDLVSDAARWQSSYQKWDSQHIAEYLSIPSLNEFISYNGSQSIQQTVGWVKSQGFGGAMTFSLNYEYLSGQTGDNRYPLSTVLSNAINGIIAPDTTPPSVPANLSATAVSSSQINLSWTASTDNVGVTGYKVYRGGTLLTTLGNVTTYSNIGLSASTNYSYTVSAYDAAGNTSSLSVSVSATTLSGIPIPGDFNLDHIVNSLDFSLLNTNWFKTNNISLYDLQVDGTVNSFDFAIFKSNWGKVW